MRLFRAVHILTLLAFLALNLGAAAFAASTADADRIFDWAERVYPTLLNPPAKSASAGEYYYRFYSGTGSYVAVQAERVLYLPAGTPLANVIEVGTVATLLAQANAASANFTLTSTAFAEGQSIPTPYACADLQGKDMSPPLAWAGTPAGTQSLALIVEDPDAPAGIWTHWVIYNIPVSLNALTEGYPLGAGQAGGIMQGLSDWNVAGYGGMCPPSGTHRYYFKLYALSSTIALPPTGGRADFLNAINGRVVGQASLMGRFSAK